MDFDMAFGSTLSSDNLIMSADPDKMPANACKLARGRVVYESGLPVNIAAQRTSKASITTQRRSHLPAH
jgi:hypothetical protein